MTEAAFPLCSRRQFRSRNPRSRARGRAPFRSRRYRTDRVPGRGLAALAAAGGMRDRAKGRDVAYSRKVLLAVTN